MNLAYRLKKKLPIYSSVAIKDSRFFAQEPNSNKREHMLTPLEEQAWTYLETGCKSNETERDIV